MGCTGTKYRNSDSQNLSSPSPRKFPKGCNIQPLIMKGFNQKLGFKYAAATITGWRDQNQDSYTVEQISEDITLFGVFDGHSGSQISLFASRNFSRILKANPHLKTKNFEKAIEESFIILDKMLITQQGKKKLLEIEKQLISKGGYRNCGNPEYYAGSTGLVLLITKQNLYLANAGDSKGIVIQGNKIVLQTIDHRPENPKESQRIVKNGGSIHNGRIFGDLNVSRGFGDYAHKQSHNIEEHIISAVPQIYKINKDKIDLILLGSDGIWQNPANQVWSQFSQKSQNLKNSLTQLQVLQCSINQYFHTNIGKSRLDIRGTDNMTAILIQLIKKSEGQVSHEVN